MKFAQELIRIAKQLLAGGSVSVDPRFEHALKSFIDEKVDRMQEKADANAQRLKHGIDFHRLESDGQKAIREVREDKREELTKEFHSILNQIKTHLNDKKKIDEIQKNLLLLSRKHSEEDDFKNPTNVYEYDRLLRHISWDVLDAFETRSTNEDTVAETRGYLENRAKKYVDFAKKFADHLKPIANELGTHLEVNGSVSEDDWFTDEVHEPSFYIKIKDTMLSLTVFQHGSKYIVEDVIDDPDFFHNSETQVIYDGLIHFLRTGQLPKDKPVKFIRLYRAMSTVEYRKWENGETIPKNKYFTNKATGDFAYDDPDLAEKIKKDPNFSYGLEQFSVRNDCVVQRDAGIFITVKECKMKDGKIVPAE